MSVLTGWLYYSAATPINPTGNLTGFHMWIDMSRITGLWAHAKSDLGDVRAALGDGTQIPCHVVNYDYSAQSGLLAVNLNKTTGNETVRIYYGNTGATTEAVDSQYGQYATYDSGVRALYPSGIGQDVTSYQNHLVSSGVVPTQKLDGPIGNRYSEYANNGAGFLTTGFPTSAPVTMISWARPQHVVYSIGIMQALQSTGANNWLILSIANIENKVPYLQSNRLGAGIVTASGSFPWAFNQWEQFAGTSQANSRTIFNSGTPYVTVSGNNFPSLIHSYGVGGWLGLSSSFSGGLAFSELHTVERPNEWVSYNREMMDQSGFWGDWIESEVSGESSFSGSSKQNLGSLISILTVGRQWLQEPGTTGLSSLLSLIALSSYSVQDSSSGSDSGTITKQNLGSLMSMLSAGRQWKQEPGTTGVASLLSLVGLSSYIVETGESGGVIFPTNWAGSYTVTPTNPIVPVTGFTFTLDLSLISGLSSLVKSDGSDIRVSDASDNQLACDLVYYNNGSGLLNWSSNKDTSTSGFKVWYGNPAATLEPATGTYGSYNAYDTGIFGYYPSGGWQDRTRYQNHLTMSGITETSGTGPITGSFYTSYNENKLAHRLTTSGTGMPFSFLGWGRTIISTGASPIRALVAMSNTGSNSNNWAVGLASLSPRIQYAGNTTTGPADIESGVWNHFTCTFTGNSDIRLRELFVNGSSHISGQGGAKPTGINLFSIGGAKTNLSNIATFNGDISLVQHHIRHLPTGYMNYDYLMGSNNATFWGIEVSSGGGGGGGYIDLSGYSDISTYIYGHYGLIKTISSNSLTTTMVDARAHLDSILHAYSNTLTSSSGDLDQEGIIVLAGIINVLTKSYGVTSAVKLASAESLTSTNSLSSAQIETLLNAIVNVYTLSNGTLDDQNQVLISGIVEVLTRADVRCSVILPISVESSTRVDSEAIGQIIAGLRSSVEVKIASYGATVQDIGLAATSSTNTSFEGSISLDLSASSIVQVLTGMDGLGSIDIEIDGNIVYIVVYITRNAAF